MSDVVTLEQAESRVEVSRRSLAQQGEGSRAALAAALLDLSRVYDEAASTGKAAAAAKESVEVLSPAFLSAPAQHASAMRAAVALYLALVRRSRETADEALLAPIAQAMGDLDRANDANDDDQP
jgi:hypothetical protein